MKQVLSVLALAATAARAPPAFAQTYRAVASGPAESPPNGSPGNSLVTIGVRAGSYTKAIMLYDEASYEPAFLAAHGGTASSAASALLDGINANEAYVNIHTGAHPGGEIRGFVVAAPIPEPAEWAMLAGGLGALLWAGRRRRPETSWQK